MMVATASPFALILPLPDSKPAILFSRKWPSMKIVNLSSEKHLLQPIISGITASAILLSSNQVRTLNPLDLTDQLRPQLLASELPLDETSPQSMTRGMTAKGFDPERYVGRWYEVAALKRGFAGQGQEDCHCTQGVYSFDKEATAIQVDTFCVHGGPDGYITGIRGKVQCLSEGESSKCYLRFPTLPFIPKEPYDVLATDYESFALISGANDRSFVQIYSRKPDPGDEFIRRKKDELANFGYDPSAIKNTPQDCDTVSDAQLGTMMAAPGMQEVLRNQFPPISLRAPVEVDPFTSFFDTFKKLLELYFKR